MKRLIFILSIALFCINSTIYAEAPTENRYRRSSLCSILLKHNEDKFANEIEEQFMNIPIPAQYNDHNLSVRVISVERKGKYLNDITSFINKNNIGSRLVAKWFDRNILTGECSMDIIKSRGLYDASELDKELAARSPRGIAMLEDAGEDLIGNTYLLVNEITYIDKNKRAKLWGAIGSSILMVAAVATGVYTTDLGNSIMDLNDIVASLKGFSVKIRTRLYRLVWDESTSTNFYTNHFTYTANTAKRDKFNQERNAYKLEYVGEIESKGSTTSFLGINEEDPYLMIRKACQRAIDENIADLQKEHEPFRIKSPIVTVDPTITVQIGLKEGITKNSKFEVLEAQEKDGRTIYKKVGTIKPIASKIWDNRFMAAEEGAYGADFGATTFTIESGKNFYPGLLVRQIE